MTGWKHLNSEKKHVTAYCKSKGYVLEKSDADYQIAKIKTDGVCLVLYPYTSNQGHTAVRVRNENSKNKELAAQIMRELPFDVRLGGMP